MKWFLKVLKNYAVFKGRTRRKEYWMSFLFFILFAIVFSNLDKILGTDFKFSKELGNRSMGFGYLYALYGFLMIIPIWAVTFRRLHDIGKSGWYIFLGIIPIIGAIWLIVLLCTDGNTGVNEYGTDPKKIVPAEKII